MIIQPLWGCTPSERSGLQSRSSSRLTLAAGQIGSNCGQECSLSASADTPDVALLGKEWPNHHYPCSGYIKAQLLQCASHGAVPGNGTEATTSSE